MKRLAVLGAMARDGVGPGVVAPTPGSELSVGEALTGKRQDLDKFMGCSIEVLDDLKAKTVGETVNVKIFGTHRELSWVSGRGGESRASNCQLVLTKRLRGDSQRA